MDLRPTNLGIASPQQAQQTQQNDFNRFYGGQTQFAGQGPGSQNASSGYKALVGQNYQTSGLGPLAGASQASSDYGKLSDSQMAGYLDPIKSAATKKLNTNAQNMFGEKGYAALNNGAQVSLSGTDAANVEAYGAGEMIKNAQQGVSNQQQYNMGLLNRQGQIGQNYFAALNQPLSVYASQFFGSQNQGVGGGVQASTPSAGGSTGVQSQPWWQTSYQSQALGQSAMNAQMAGSNAQAAQGNALTDYINGSMPDPYPGRANPAIQQQPVNPYANIYPGTPQEPSNNMNYGYGGLA